MARKTLKQKLRKSLRDARVAIAVQHQMAGITINFEQSKLQAIAMAHGIMGTLHTLKLKMVEQGKDPSTCEIYKAVEVSAQNHIAQCVQKLMSLQMPLDEINARIKVGH